MLRYTLLVLPWLHMVVVVVVMVVVMMMMLMKDNDDEGICIKWFWGLHEGVHTTLCPELQTILKLGPS